MALRIQTRKWVNKDGTVSSSWRLIVDDWSGTSRTCTYPEKRHYHRYGLDPDDPVTVAKEKLSVVRARLNLERQLVRRSKIEKIMKERDKVKCAYLPAGLYADFIRFLLRRRMWDEIPKGVDSHLVAMRNLVTDLSICPSTYGREPGVVHSWFKKKAYSLSYMEKVLPLLNLYGYFYCDTLKLPFLAVPTPRGVAASKIDDANYEARDGATNVSDPLTLADLPKLDTLIPEQRRWMHWSFFFGLRPSEVDRIVPKLRGRIWDVQRDPKGTPFLKVLQPKLVKLQRERRWKRIPAVLPEQKEIIREMEEGLPVKRPLKKTIEDRLTAAHGLYAGRKGFKPMMQAKGKDPIHISHWLGHRGGQTTEDHYSEKEAVYY